MEKQKKGMSKKKIRIILIVVAVVVVLCVFGVFFLRKKVTETFGSAAESTVQTAEVETGSIKTVVSGTGTLASVDVEEITLYDGVEVTDTYVSAGDTVSQGDLIAAVNSASVMTAMGEVQDEISALDEEIEEADGEEADTSIESQVAGRVKKIYGAAGDDVSSVMYENGCLALLSLDGYLYAEVETDQAAAGDEVTVTASDGTAYTGSVESVKNGTATVLVTDDGTAYGDEVTVSKDGAALGSGTLAIHEQIRITGYAGTVSSVDVSENESISAGECLFTLSDTGYSANYTELLKQREDLEEELQDLIAIYKTGGVTAPVDGVVESIQEADSASSGSSSSGSSSTGSSSSSSSSGSSSSGSSSSGSSSTGSSSGGSSTGSSLTSASSVSALAAAADAASSSSGSSEDTADAFATVSPDSRMQIVVSVDETDILSLQEGQSASVVIDSIGEDAYSGTVTEVDTAASSASGVTSYTATVTIDKTADMLSGMSASVSITTEGVENALIIPEEALNKTRDGYYVYTSYDEANDELGGMTQVSVGMTNGTSAEITDGLSQGDTVYYNGTDSSQDEGGFGGRGNMDFQMNNGDMPDTDNMPDRGNMQNQDGAQGRGGMNNEGGAPAGGAGN